MNGLTEIQRMNMRKERETREAARKARLSPWRKFTILVGYTTWQLGQIIKEVLNGK